jgi:hypothetical protein
MNKLEKIASATLFAAGLGLFSYGLYKNNSLLIGAGLISGSGSAGLALREPAKEEEKKYLEESNISYPK